MQKSNTHTSAELLSQLNNAQRAAVEFCDGPSLVIAGAGSGKTRVLTYKIAHLLEQGLPPYHILALTFTNKAAREMKSRIADLVGERKARQLWMGTFHSMFSRILRNESERLGFQSNFTIFDASDSKNLVKLIIKEMQLDDKIYKPGGVHSQISRAKNNLITPKTYAQNGELIEYDRRAKRPQLFEIYQKYQVRLRGANSMDFDDLLLYTNILFRDHADVLESYRNYFRYILVDEYQDTNFSQHLIIKQLADTHHRVCVVGDDAQSIYSFRGANIDNILKFRSNFPETRTFKLEQNYRSTQNIVNAANSLIKNNKEQIFKNVFSENAEGEKIELVGAFSDFEEGLIVANKIARLRLEAHAAFSDFAILYRTNAQSRLFEEALRKKNIPYRIYGGLSFYQRKEIKNIISYFRLIVNPSDEEAFRRIINYPKRGIGNTTVQKIVDAAQLHHVSLWEITSNPTQYNLPVNVGTIAKLKSFRDLMQKFIDKNRKINAYELTQIVLKNSGIAGEAYEDKTAEGMSRAQNMQELQNAIHTFVDTRVQEGSDEVSLVDFLSEVSLLTDQDTDNEAEKEKITLMTIHASKGLEFKHVFVVGLEENLFPSEMALREMRGLEEERRLFYVAITRAEETCTLSFAKSRFKNGQTTPMRESRFLNDIAPEYLNTNNFSGFQNQSQKESPDGFWSSFRKNKNTVSRSLFSSHDVAAKKTVRATKSTTSVKLSDEAMTLSEGNIIEHSRFGRGKVRAIELTGHDKRAIIDFDNTGEKTLLLKFARFKIVKE